MKVGSRKQRLDNFLPFTASYMTVLASAESPRADTEVHREKDPKFMLSDEVANVIGRIDLLGYDVIQRDERGSRTLALGKLPRSLAGLQESSGPVVT